MNTTGASFLGWIFRIGVASTAVVGLATWGATDARGQGRALVISTGGDAATPVLPDIDDEEILVFTPGSGRSMASFTSDLSWRVLLGDANGNGHFDDEPAEIDAIAFAPIAPSRPTIYDAYVSFGSTQPFVSGEQALDGDIVRLLPNGSIQVVFPESLLAAATGTSSIDLDAIALDASGSLYFSFAESETTTVQSLITANGSEVLEDGTVLRLAPGETTATIVFRETDVIAFVSNALGRTVSSVVDVGDVEIDPSHVGQLLFVVSSTASGLEGTVFSTAFGGSIGSLNGISLTGSAFGFATEETLDGLAIVPDFGTPLALEVDSPNVSLGSTSQVTVRILHGTPGSTVRLLASVAPLPYLAPTPTSGGGVGLLYVDTTSPLYQRSRVRANWTVLTDASGSGAFVYSTSRSAVGMQRILQPLDELTGELGDAIVLEAVP